MEYNMKRKTLTGILAGALSLAFLLSACTGQPSASQTPGATQTPGASTPAPTELKDTLNIAITAQPPTLDAPTTASNAAAGIAIHIFESLFTLDSDYQPAPALAESYAVSDDGLVYTFPLRQGVKFHNGKDLTAEDVVASMNRWLETSSRAKSLLAGAVFAQEDTYTVTLTVPTASADVLELIAAPSQFAAISPKEIVDAAGPEGITEYIGTGPYKLQEWKADQYIHLVRYEDYQSHEGASSGFTGEKQAATENLIFRFVTDHATRIAGIQTGEYDVAEAVPLERYEELSGNTDLALYTKSSGNLNLFLNTTQGILANKTIRQAVLAALNNEDIMLAAFGDPNLYSLSPSFANPSQPQWATESGAEFYNQNDPEKAKALLAEAGYHNEPIVLVTTPDYEEMYKATLVVQEQLRQAGFNAEVQSYDFTVFMEHRSDVAQFDLFITSNSYGLNPSQFSVVTAGWAGLNQSEVTAGVEGIRYATSPEAAADAWKDLQQFIYEFGAASVLGQYSAAVATRNTVAGFDYFHYPVYWNVTVSK